MTLKYLTATAAALVLAAGTAYATTAAGDCCQQAAECCQDNADCCDEAMGHEEHTKS